MGGIIRRAERQGISDSHRHHALGAPEQFGDAAGGAVADTLGLFRISDLKSGIFKLKISSLSYADTTLVIDTKSETKISLGTIRMARDAIMLDETIITALLPKMVVRDDTIVYNADAYQVPEGSAIEALVEQLPGAKIDDSGKTNLLCITPNYLLKVCNQVAHTSPQNYINNYVFMQAQHLLLNKKEKSLQEIADELGFSTQAFFTNFFKRAAGISPSEYRLQ